MNLDKISVHITCRSQNREKFKVPLHDAWGISCGLLRFVTHSFDIQAHAFVMMPNHIHLLATGEKQTIASSMRYFLTETSRQFNKFSAQINHSWGQRHRPTLIKDQHHFDNAYKYIYYNPVDAKIVSRVEDYPYSSIRGLIGQEISLLTIHDELLNEADLGQHLKWLNTPPPQEDLLATKLALRRRVFKYPKIDSRKHYLNERLL